MPSSVVQLMVCGRKNQPHFLESDYQPRCSGGVSPLVKLIRAENRQDESNDKGPAKQPPSARRRLTIRQPYPYKRQNEAQTIASVYLKEIVACNACRVAMMLAKGPD